MSVWFALFMVLGGIGTWLARRYALSRALVDHPGERRSHSIPTPRGGGIAIVALVLAAVVASALRHPVHAVPYITFGVGLCAVALVGLVDDHRPLSPWLRLVVHFLASAALAAAWLHHGGGIAEAAAAFAACAVMTNVWNFMDGINGIAATQAVLAALVIATVSDAAWTWVALALAAACLGFLPFNFPRARIFLGDVGSGSLGYCIGALAVIGAPVAHAATALVLMAISAFVLDSSLTLLRRLIRGEPWWTPHVQHAYQACARRWGHPRVTISYCGWTLLSVLIAHRVAGSSEPRLTWAVTGAWYICGGLLWLWLQHRCGGRMDPAGTVERMEGRNE